LELAERVPDLLSVWRELPLIFPATLGLSDGVPPLGVSAPNVAALAKPVQQA
jgi:hypothetical protein